MPALIEAVAQLNSLTNQDIGNIKAMQTPRSVVQEACYLTHLVLDPSAGPEWSETKSKMLTNANLLRDLKAIQEELDKRYLREAYESSYTKFND